jgi:hypothetical protein
MNVTLHVVVYVHNATLIPDISGSLWAISNMRTYRHEAPLCTQLCHLLSVQGKSDGESTQMIVIVM